MGADLDPHDPISQLANAHFPELSAFDEGMGAGGGNSGGGDGGMNLDFMPLGNGGDFWNIGKEWGGGSSDLDGFPLQNGLF